MSLPFKPMAILEVYKAKLPMQFWDWYHGLFTNPRRHYGHWSACDYVTDFPQDYQEVVEDPGAQKSGWHGEITTHNGDAKFVRNASPTFDMFRHTYHRNTGAWATCLACGTDLTPEDPGREPPSPDQIELLISVSIEDHTNLHVPVENFMTHGEAADNMDFANREESYGLSSDPDQADELAEAKGFPHAGYGPHSGALMRWDLEGWVNPDTREFRPYAMPCPQGWVRLADYIRGRVILGIAAATEDKWRK